jgi:2-methylcitrate dehydratase PrpD
MTVETAAGPYTRQLAEYVDGLSYEDLPAPVIEKAKGALFDTLGAAFAGSARPHAKRGLSVVRSLGGVPESTILGTSEKTAADRAAFLNSLFGSSAPQLDDVYKDSLGHPGVGTIPGALAVGERVRAGGEQVITAIVAGYEMATRIGSVVGREAFDRGWHPRAGCNVFAAAVASAKLLGLKGPETYCAVLGLAGNKASGLTSAAFFHEAFYTLSGNASRDGVEAALLAEAGYDAGCTILEAEYGGYCRLVCDNPDWARLTDGLGERFGILGIAQKPHSSCMCAHAAIDATLSIVEQQDIRPEDVKWIRVQGFKEMTETFGRRYPENHIHATMSIPYLVAVAITDRQVLPSQLDRLTDPEVASLQERMELVLDPELEMLYPHYLGAVVEIDTMDGAQHQVSVRIPKGDPENPLSQEELRGKFRSLAGEILDADAVEEAVEIVDALETLSDIGALTSVLRRLR